MDYKYIISEYGDIQGCDSCTAEAPLAEFTSDNPKLDKRIKHICNLCAGSFVGNATEWPRQHDNVTLFQTIAQIGNLILDEITGRKPKEK